MMASPESLNGTAKINSNCIQVVMVSLLLTLPMSLPSRSLYSVYRVRVLSKVDGMMNSVAPVSVAASTLPCSLFLSVT